METVLSNPPTVPWSRKLPGSFGASAGDMARRTQSGAVGLEELLLLDDEETALDDEETALEDDALLLDWLDEPRLD
jgi:hypothetical protein